VGAEAADSSTRGVAPRTALAIAIAALAMTAAGLFTRLGHYPFWGDEADTVIFARGVWETGDTSAWYGENLYAYRNGTLLSHLNNRSTPPASYYLAAPIWGLFGADHLSMRAPFALCGWLTVALVLWWAFQRRVSTPAFALLGAALATNVALLLYSRQCRYYSLGILLTVVTAYLYETYDGSRRRRVQLVAALLLLAATHYLNFAALAAALVVDYGLWRRRTMRLSLTEWAELVLPTAVLLGVLVYFYNPLGRNTAPIDIPMPEDPPSLAMQKLKLLWWGLRDLAFNEFGAGVLLIAAPIVALLGRNWAVLRLYGAALVFVAATTAASPQPVIISLTYDIRYLAPLIVPCIVLSVATATGLAGRRACLAIGILAAATALNVRHAPWTAAAWRPTIWSFAEELRNPRLVAGRMLSDWLRENASPGQSVWIVPGEWTAPQIVETPQLIYGWQLENPTPESDYAGAPRILFSGEEAVDWIVAMGYGNLPEAHAPDHVRRVVLPLLADRGFHYEEVATLDTHFDDHTRPELHWHWFQDAPYDKTNRQIYIFRRTR
jgi:hypothetical protein